MASQSQYTNAVLEHYKNPYNYGVLQSPDYSHEATNRICGDRIRLDVNVENGHISEVRFSGRGCALSIAATSILTTMIKGQPIEKSVQIELAQILEQLGLESNLRRSRLNCAMLGLKALNAAIT